MGRRSKPPVEISFVEVRTEVALNDGMPPFKRYVDVPFVRASGKRFLTRLFFMSPTPEEVSGTTVLKEQLGKQLSVLGARMPFMPAVARISPALYDYCRQNDLSEDFAKLLVRLVICYLEGKHHSAVTLSEKSQAYRALVAFLVTYFQQPALITLADINKQFWLAYREACMKENRVPVIKDLSNGRAIFATYPPTSLGGWLRRFRLEGRNWNPAPEHTSELPDAGYSDEVMYQILALCLEGFHRRIGYLKRYESLTEADMPQDWLYPGRDNTKPAHGARRTRPKKGETFETESFLLLSQWLNDDVCGYQILIDHFIMHQKAGLLVKGKNGRLVGGIAGTLHGLQTGNKLVPQVRGFLETTAQWHGFSFKKGTSVSLLSFYLKKKTATEKNIVIDQIAWCLANLFMMQTGVNKEVVLSIPSTGEDGRSILMRANSLFISSNGDATEVELYGFKERSGSHVRKIISIPIVKESPLYQMLLAYERHVKVNPEGPFFEVRDGFVDCWNTAGGLAEFARVYPILGDDGNPLTSIQTPRFRKVFASGQLLDRLKGIRDANDLAQKLREDLHHGNLDTTLTHYLLKTNVGRSVIDIAIATITSEKLAEALRFKGKIDLIEGSLVKKKVFLCDCEDPTNPSHDVAISKECKHYDLCLGCERSIVTGFHLPYICLRILQYEQERLRDPQIWPATFEDRWMIAHDALDQYVAKDNKNGQRLVDEAWAMALEGSISLPPIINSNRM